MADKKLKLVTTAEVKEILLREMDERIEPTNEQKYAREHADRFGKSKGAEAVELIDGLMEKIPRVKEHLAYKIADILPEHPDDVKAIFARERYSLAEEEIKEILDIVKEYLPEE